MAKRRAKKATKQPASSPEKEACDADPKVSPVNGNGDAFDSQEVERQSAAIRTIRDVEVERLLTGLRLLRSNFSKERLQTPVLQFFRENLPNLEVITTGNNGQFEVQWKDKDDNLSLNADDVGNAHLSLLRQMSLAYPDCSAAMPSLGGFEFSSKAVKTNLHSVDNLQFTDFALEEPSDTHLLGFQDSLRTPGACSQRLSVGMTPKTMRVPKHGEMLVSVHGSPLGVFKEENMEAIHEAAEE